MTPARTLAALDRVEAARVELRQAEAALRVEARALMDERGLFGMVSEQALRALAEGREVRRAG